MDGWGKGPQEKDVVEACLVEMDHKRRGDKAGQAWLYGILMREVAQSLSYNALQVESNSPQGRGSSDTLFKWEHSV